jgi:putative ABC transport system permease protein
MTPLKLAILSLIRHQFATVITVIAIGLSVACSGILLRLNQLSESRFAAMGHGGDAIVGAKAGGIEILISSLNGEGEFPEFLPYKLFESLRNDQSVKFEDGHASKPTYIKSIIPFVYFGKFSGFRMIGTDDSFLHRPTTEDSPTVSSGKWFEKAGDVVLGSIVAQTHNLKVGDLIKASPWIGDLDLPTSLELKVVGILAPTQTQWDRSLFSNLEQAQQVFTLNSIALSKRSIWGPAVLHYFLVYVHPAGFAELETLINKRTVGQVVQVEQQKKRLKELSSVGKNIGFFITGFIILLGGLSVCSMLLTRFEGMSLQLAVLRALGYTKRELSKWLLWEGLLLGMIGVVFGALLDAIGLPMIRSILGSALPSPELVASSLWDSSMIWLITIVATMTSVLVPMLKMSLQNTHNSLKGL